jgi:hypothetical protein
MSEVSRRRWFRFSLRTLFVVVTVLGCWLAGALQQLHRRQAVRLSVESGDGYFMVGLNDNLAERIRGEPLRKVPFALRILGGQPAQVILLTQEQSRDSEEIAAVFPEAVVRQSPKRSPICGD